VMAWIASCLAMTLVCHCDCHVTTFLAMTPDPSLRG